MSSLAFESYATSHSTLGERVGRLLFLPQRINLSRALVTFCFVWPFLNYAGIDPSSTMEINFLPVFLAVVLLPEIFWRDWKGILLLMPVFAVAIAGAPVNAALRVAIGVIPLHFIINLTHYLDDREQSLLPSGLAYCSLQVFVGFCILQTIHLQLFPILPGPLVEGLTTLVPRYAQVPYDFSGIRGVQGWASEPSSAGLTCMAFALVSLRERPDRRWRVLGLFALLVFLNKSVYALLLYVLLVGGCLLTIRHKVKAFLATIPLAGLVGIYLSGSARLAELRSNLIADGMNRQSNHELMRFLQILDPLQQFPHVYKPTPVWGDWIAEPMGLLPLVLGYGSVAGLIWLAYVLFRNFSLRRIELWSLALVAAFALLIMSSPDLIPCIVAFAVFSVHPKTRQLTRHAILG